ncbi:MAG: hypothetical protein K6T34_07490 [Thermoflavifilum sp.]|nr:hypothetical protein [Thermoflavifilum sp.]
MKLLRAIVVIILSILVIASCKKNDSTPTGQAALVGKWQGQKIQVAYLWNGLKLYDTTANITPPNYLTIEFRVDSVAIINQRLTVFGDSTAREDTAYYLVNANQIVITGDIQHSQLGQTFTYQLSGNQLKLNGETNDTTSQGIETYQYVFYLNKM